ncbi:MAG: hypothetical protein JNM25_16970 [Planctomycetes bacterium]|nr:hypothetical protein [Planctomycetota bacterium]
MRSTAPTTPRPPLAYRIGVSGHRHDRLQAAELTQLAAGLHHVCRAAAREVADFHAEHRDLFATHPPIVRAISSLAEGVDRLFAEAALASGLELHCVFPFPRSEFEQDFVGSSGREPDSRERFRTLAAQATACLELDGSRTDEPGAYTMCGHVVVAQVDLLVVVWDGHRGDKRGGTEDAAAHALGSGVPVLWIDAQQPHRWQVLPDGKQLPYAERTGRATPARDADPEGLRAAIRRQLRVPADSGQAASSRAPEADLRRFYHDRPRVHAFAAIWPLFRRLVGDFQWRRSRERAAPADARPQPLFPPAPADPTSGRLTAYYTWADNLSVRSADRYRSAFVLAFLLAALAVGMALLPMGTSLDLEGPAAIACNVVELVAIALILVLVSVGLRAGWHERWIDYRLLAEMIRQLQITAPAGGGQPLPQLPAHWSAYGHPRSSWMGWYVRAIERWLGMPTGVVDRHRLAGDLTRLELMLRSQGSFHELASERAHRIEHRLHWCGIATLVVTAVCCILHLLLHPWHPPSRVTAALTFFCGFLPALGAAVAGISNQGEFRRIGKRSRAMQEQLRLLVGETQRLRERLADEHAQRPMSPAVAELAARTARLMVTEVLDWRVVFLDQPLRPPA